MDITMIALPGNKPSKVCKICVSVGDSVAVGQELVVVESAKGARTIKSSIAGKVESITVAEGDMVVAKQLLMDIAECSAVVSTVVEMIALPGNKPSKVCKVCVAVGDSVAVGQELVAVESAKGARTIKSSVAGKVASIAVAEGDMVVAKDKLLVIEGVAEVATDKASADNLVIIGGGPGGYVAAIYAAKKGKKVTVVEKYRLGGTCLNVGCIPTKSIIKSSEVYHHITSSQEFGLEIATTAKVDMGKVVDRKNGVVDTLVGGIESLMDKNDITVIHGDASFVDSHNIAVATDKGNVNVAFGQCIIATGTKISRPNIAGIDSSFVLDSTEALDMRQLPSSMAIIGGGVIGMEFAFLLRGFGVDVTVVEYCDHLLGNTDSDMVEEILHIAGERGIKVYLSSGVTSCEPTTTGGKVNFVQNGQQMSISCDKALLAFGRIACIDGIGLDKAGVELTERKNFVKVDDTMATNVDNIYAIGDVNGLIQLAHAASHQGIVAVNNILGHKEHFDVNMVPSVIFTSPEIASVGISEDMAKASGIQHKVGKFHFASNGKAQAMGEPVGFVKLISNMQDVVIGGAVIGPDAGTIIATITLAVNNKMKVSAITDTIFAHPTTAEAIHEAGMALGIGCLHE